MCSGEGVTTYSSAPGVPTHPCPFAGISVGMSQQTRERYSSEVKRQPVRRGPFLEVCTVQYGSSVVSRIAIMVFHKLLCVAGVSKDLYVTTGCPNCWQTLMSFMLALTTTDTAPSCETISRTSSAPLCGEKLTPGGVLPRRSLHASRSARFVPGQKAKVANVPKGAQNGGGQPCTV